MVIVIPKMWTLLFAVVTRCGLELIAPFPIVLELLTVLAMGHVQLITTEFQHAHVMTMDGQEMIVAQPFAQTVAVRMDLAMVW